MDKRQLSEREICAQYITPAIARAGWDTTTQVREEFAITDGRIIVQGKLPKRATPKRADYVLFYKPNIPIAVVEAKRNSLPVADGIPQGLGYAEMLQVPFVFSSNGDAFWFHSKIAEAGIDREIALKEFPSPDTLWQWWSAHKGLSKPQAALVTQDYYDSGENKTPRYYQMLAINKTTEAVALGKNRILLVMAVGTGKTFVAFQVIWRLWKAKAKKRIIFLTDRRVLIDQTINAFKPFGSAMTRLSSQKVDKSYQIYLSTYQTLIGTDKDHSIYKRFSPDFFDLIVVDNCHRGSARENSVWRDILDYFSAATQIGLTATPKETTAVSNIDYFGEPIYTYSLRQGIYGGFLAPYKVIRIDLEQELSRWQLNEEIVDRASSEIQVPIHNQKKIEELLLAKRTQLVAHKISEYLRQTNRFDKTIVFCENIDHAEQMREALAHENQDLVAENSKYVIRITSDSLEVNADVYDFVSPESRYPVIVTTSRLVATEVDTQTCKLIVLDKQIRSMTELKQVIGRGIRINEDYGKFYFTILDFKNATELFADPSFDGDPVQIYKPRSFNDSYVPPEDPGIADEINQIVGQERSQILEYKAVLPTSNNIAQLISSFANADGGYIVLGVSSDLKVRGLSDDVPSDEITRRALDLLSPQPQIHSQYFVRNGQNIYVIKVEKSDLQVFVEGKAAYIRIGLRNKLLNSSDIVFKANGHSRLKDINNELAEYKEKSTDSKAKLIEHYQSILKIIDDLEHTLYPEAPNIAADNQEGRILTRILFTSFVDNFEKYLADILLEIFLVQPSTLRSKQTVSVEEVLRCSNLEEFIEYWANQRLGKLQKGSVKGFIADNKQISSLDVIDKSTQEKIEKILQIRHLYSHRNGIVDEKFLRYFANEFPLNSEHTMAISQILDMLSYLVETADRVDVAAIDKYQLSRVSDE